MTVDSEQQAGGDRDLELTKVISTAGTLSPFDPEVVAQLVSTVDRLHAELIDDGTLVADTDVLSAVVDAARALADVRDLLQHRIEPAPRASRLLVDVMDVFNQVGVDRLRPDVLKRILGRLEQPRNVSVSALQRRLGAYGVPLRNNRTGLKYYLLADIQHVTGFPSASRKRPQLLVEVDEFCQGKEASTVRRHEVKSALVTRRPVLASISDADFGSIVRPYGVTSYWRGCRCLIVALQVRRALSRYDAAL